MNRKMATIHLRALILALAALLVGCASYESILIKTEPPGALVSVNGGLIGESPIVYQHVDHSFKHGIPTLSIEAEKNGYSPGRRQVRALGCCPSKDNWPDAVLLRLDGAALISLPLRKPDDRAIDSIVLPKPTGPTHRIAVLDLAHLGLSKNEVLTLSENLRASLVATEYFTVVSRADMQSILQEHDFQRSDLVEPTNLAKLGKILSVQKIVSGSVGSVGKTHNLTVRIVDVESAKIDRAITKDVSAKPDDLLPVVRNIARQLALQYVDARESSSPNVPERPLSP